ncbi:hypothetical protein QE443_000394 [Pantoea ananatis]|nr:hypothetical protein [Pantoea ananatis]
MQTVGTPLLWGSFAVVVVIMLAIDLFLQGRRGSQTMSFKQAAVWSLIWVCFRLAPVQCCILVVSGRHRRTRSRHQSDAGFPDRLRAGKIPRGR